MASERIERKLAAIVAADVAGFSRLMAADEESTVARLKAHRKALIDPKIAEHGGRIVKTTGDGMLVEFASVVDAVRCVVEIQRGMLERNADVPKEKRIDFRFGVNVGDVIVDGDDIYGDGVNVAARLEDLAEPGGVLVAGVVRDQVRDKLSFSFDDLGDREVKNIPRPVRAYRVKLSDDRRPPALARLSTRLGVGRPHIAWIGAAGLLLIVVAGGGAWYVCRRPKIGRDGRATERSLADSSRTGQATAASLDRRAAVRKSLRRCESGLFRRRHHGKSHHQAFPPARLLRDRAQHRLHFQGQEC